MNITWSLKPTFAMQILNIDDWSDTVRSLDKT